MGKYEQQLETLNQQWELEGKKVSEEFNQINGISSQYCNKFNSLVTIINIERHLMRREIKSLYKFLKLFGDVGEKVTLFDYSPEDWLFAEGYSKEFNNFNKKESKKKNPLDFSGRAFKTASLIGATATTGIIGATAATGMFGASAVAGAASFAAGTTTLGMVMPSFAPVAIPAYLLIKGFKDKEAKERLMEMNEKFEEQKIQWQVDLAKMEDEASFFSTAVDIADMYRILIAQVRDTISEKIIPEFNGILSFLYADAIKNCIINHENPDDVKMASISEYRGTPYESHYTFVQNVFDYYTLITNFFTEPILSNLIQKREITKSDYERFQKKLRTIGEQQVELQDNAAFGGESE